MKGFDAWITRKDTAATGEHYGLFLRRLEKYNERVLEDVK